MQRSFALLGILAVSAIACNNSAETTVSSTVDAATKGAADTISASMDTTTRRQAPATAIQDTTVKSDAGSAAVTIRDSASGPAATGH